MKKSQNKELADAKKHNHFNEQQYRGNIRI